MGGKFQSQLNPAPLELKYVDIKKNTNNCLKAIKLYYQVILKVK